ncbi:MAG TPA: hypothetical protein VE869_05475 [Gemmatimonas sp.]|nr:hypothetical protein [Gemmatimonas sp.]
MFVTMVPCRLALSSFVLVFMFLVTSEVARGQDRSSPAASIAIMPVGEPITMRQLAASDPQGAFLTAPVALTRPSRTAFADAPTSRHDAAVFTTRQRRCPMVRGEWWKMPLLAVGAFVVPVAGISALVADESGRAATGAMIAGTAYSVGATLVLVRMASCSSTSPLIFIYTPFAAAAGAFIATR